MELFLQGIQMGLGLSILVGPIVFALIQTSLEHGYKFGLIVAVGIWISDICIISLVYNSLTYIKVLTASDWFELSVGIIGGLILFGVGVGALLSKQNVNIDDSKAVERKGNVIVSLIKGIAINAINPFTIIFWLGVSSKILITDGVEAQKALYFFAGIITMLVITDSLKVLLAEKLRKYMNPTNLIFIRKLSGVVFIAFGFFMIVKVLY